MVASGRSIARNSGGIADVLLSAVLEWTLILLLLINGAFSYLIGKFAAFFGLSAPCIVCSRLDHLFEPRNGRPPLRDLLCDGHAAEASSLGSEGGDAGRACSSAPPGELEQEGLRCPSCGMVIEDEFYSYLLLDPPPAAPGCSQKRNFIGLMANREEHTSGKPKREEVELSNQIPKMVVETEKIEEVIAHRDDNNLVDDASMEVLTQTVKNAHYEEQFVPVALVDCTTTMGEDNCIGVKDDSVLGNVRFDQECMTAALEIHDLLQLDSSRSMQLEGAIGCIQDGENVLVSDAKRGSVMEVNLRNVKQTELEENVLELDAERVDMVEKISVSDTKRGSIMEVNSRNVKQTEMEENDLALDPERVDMVAVDAVIFDASSYSEKENAYTSANEKANSMGLKFPELNGIEQPAVVLDAARALEEKSALHIDVEGCDIISMNSPRHEKVEKGSLIVDAEDVLEVEKALPSMFETVDSIEEKTLVISALQTPSNSSDNHSFEGIPDTVLNNNVVEQAEALIGQQDSPEEQGEVGQLITTTKSPDRLFGQEPSDMEEERAPETPTSFYDIHGLHKRFLFGRTESLDGSVTSEVESCDSLTLEQLRSTLRTERKALHALYAELEEERSAAAIATNQTMAMINRLQEEKAAMQMEALQYQRMMEEQSEYDQEALQLLNDLLLKREKEKQELENELEVCRKRVYLYEMRERRITMNKVNGRCATNSSSSAENTDDLSIGFQEGDDYALSLDDNHHGPVNDELSSKIDRSAANRTMTVTEPFDNFERERLSVLEELKALELKLITLEDQNTDNLEDFDNFPDKNDLFSNMDYEYPGDDRHDALDGFSDDLNVNGKLYYERRKGLRGKRLSPLFDAISNENVDLCTAEEADNASDVKEQKCYNQHPLDDRSSGS